MIALWMRKYKSRNLIGKLIAIAIKPFLCLPTLNLFFLPPEMMNISDKNFTFTKMEFREIPKVAFD